MLDADVEPRTLTTAYARRRSPSASSSSRRPLQYGRLRHDAASMMVHRAQGSSAVDGAAYGNFLAAED